MTERDLDNCFSALGKAFAERRTLRRELHEIEDKLKVVTDKITKILAGAVQEVPQDLQAATPNPLDQAKALIEGRRRLAELDKILAE